MAWLTCDAYGMEHIHSGKPKRLEVWAFPSNEYRIWGGREKRIPLPSGSIEKLIGRPMTWSDEPQEI